MGKGAAIGVQGESLNKASFISVRQLCEKSSQDFSPGKSLNGPTLDPS